MEVSVASKSDDLGSRARARRTCDRCASPSAALQCGRCKSAYYCDPVCQRADWRNGHRLVCAEVARPASPDVEDIPSDSSDSEAEEDKNVSTLTASRSYICYSDELETLRWGWSAYIGLDQIVDVRLITRRVASIVRRNKMRHEMGAAEALEEALEEAQNEENASVGTGTQLKRTNTASVNIPGAASSLQSLQQNVRF